MNDYLKIKKLIDDADAIVLGAGAGLSTSAGINYGEGNFKENFPELYKNYGMTDMYTSSFYNFNTEEERWSYWSKHINYLYNTNAKDVYLKLFSLVKDKNYFVITTNVDGQFLKAGFDRKKVFEVQGSLSKMQCSTGCHNKLYDDLEMVSKMLKYKDDIRVPTNLVPYCPACGGKMEVNLRKDAFFVEDDSWKDLNKSYEKFLNENKNKRLVLIELGAGFNTPGIIRFPFEQLTYNLDDITLIRINDKYFDVPFEIKDKTITVNEDCSLAVSKIID